MPAGVFREELSEMTNKRRVLLASVASAVLVAAAGSAQAGGFALREQSSYYQGMSFAGYGTTGPSISSMFWNPAALSGAGAGFTSETHNTLIVPESTIDGTFTPGAVPASSVSSGDIGSDAYIPASYVSYRLNDQAVFGVSINAPFGLSTKADFNWAGQFYSRTSKVTSVNVTPTLSYQINDMIAIGLGLQIQQFKVRLTTGIPNPPGFPSSVLEGEDIGFGATAGLIFRPFEGTEIGLGYRSAVGTELEGTVVSPGVTVLIGANLVTPDQVNLSLKQRVNDAFRVFGTVEWTNWSRLKAPRVFSTVTNAPVTTLKFNYDDGWFFALGGEYDVTKDLTLRAGAAYEISPVDDQIRSTRLPDNDRVWLSAGASYSWNDNLAFDLGYTHIFTAKSTPINISGTHQDYNALLGTFNGSANSSVNIVSASMRYNWGGALPRPQKDASRGY